LYIEFYTRISNEAALLELKVASSTQREEGTGGNRGKAGIYIDFRITLEQLELADVEAEV
jgi:hypothetical protein